MEKMFFEWKLCHFVNLLRYAKRWHNSDCCLILTQDSNLSESVESANFIEKFDHSWVSQPGPSGYQQGKFGKFCQKCLWPVWRTSQCWNHWDHPRSYVYSMYSFQGIEVDKTLMHKFVWIFNFAQNYGINDEYKQGLPWQFKTNLF